jgi:hypothetical protein
MAKPAGPIVSCPTMPWRWAVASSRPLLDAADPDAREHEAGAAHARAERSGPRDACAGRQPLRDAGDGRQALLVGVVERDLFNRQV